MHFSFFFSVLNDTYVIENQYCQTNSTRFYVVFFNYHTFFYVHFVNSQKYLEPKTNSTTFSENLALESLLNPMNQSYFVCFMSKN